MRSDGLGGSLFDVAWLTVDELPGVAWCKPCGSLERLVLLGRGEGELTGEGSTAKPIGVLSSMKLGDVK
jgi:hypothetical protein